MMRMSSLLLATPVEMKKKKGNCHLKIDINFNIINRTLQFSHLLASVTLVRDMTERLEDIPGEKEILKSQL